MGSEGIGMSLKFEGDFVYLPDGHCVGFYSPVTDVSVVDAYTYLVKTELGEYHLCTNEGVRVLDISGKSIYDLQDEHLRSVGEHELADDIARRRKWYNI